MQELTDMEQHICTAAAQGLVEHASEGYQVSVNVLDTLCIHTGAERISNWDAGVTAFNQLAAWTLTQTPR